jgi:Peptidase family M1 domain
MLPTTRGKSWGSGFRARPSPRSCSLQCSSSPRRGGRALHGRELGPRGRVVPECRHGGYDVTHYDLALDYDPVSDRLDGRAVITATQAVDPRRNGANLAIAGRVIDLFSEIYGPYPWEAAGGIVDFAPDVGYALETQTKANYSSSPGMGTVVHEISHEWFGNAVSLDQWKNIWLNEGFARWSEWIWTERTGGRSAQAAFDAAYATPDTNTGFWNPPPADPGDAESIFDGTIYTRGAMTLQALRQKIGDADFFELLQTWYARHKYGNASTEDFTALAEEVSGRDLIDFFRIWLHTPGKPAPGSW